MAKQRKHESGRPWAEDVAYFKTSRTPPAVWLENTEQLLVKLGASDILKGFVGQSYVVTFTYDGRPFRLSWPQLPTKSGGGDTDARRQAATFLYYYCKALVLAAKVLGVKSAFAGQMIRDDGKTTSERESDAVDVEVIATRPLGS